MVASFPPFYFLFSLHSLPWTVGEILLAQVCFASSAYNNCFCYDFCSPRDVSGLFCLVCLIYCSTLDFSIWVFTILTFLILPIDHCSHMGHSQTYHRILGLATTANYRTVNRDPYMFFMSWTFRHTSARTFVVSCIRAIFSKYINTKMVLTFVEWDLSATTIFASDISQ